MQRTQVYLSEKEKTILSSLSISVKKPVSELIRAAIDKCYINKKHDFSNALGKVSGIWKGREDITADYVRQLRPDRRSKTIR